MKEILLADAVDRIEAGNCRRQDHEQGPPHAGAYFRTFRR